MKKLNSKIWYDVGIAAGIIAICFGIYFFSGGKSFYEPSSAEFGGDFYTYQYKATRYAAMNIAMIGGIIKTFAAAMLTSFGIADIAYFFAKKAEMSSSDESIIFSEKMQPNNTEEIGKTEQNQ